MAILKFPRKTIEMMGKSSIRESDIHDVFSHGNNIAGKNGMVRKYNGYEIGFFYATDPITGEYIVTYAWKRERR